MRTKRTRSALKQSPDALLWPAISRRWLLRTGSAGLGAALLSGGGASVLMPRPALATGGRPLITHGLQSGDVSADGAIVWARTDRPARMIVDYALSDSFADSSRIVGQRHSRKATTPLALSLRGCRPARRCSIG